MMLDIKPVVCQLPTSQINTTSPNALIYRTKYPDIPRTTRLLDRKRSIFFLKEKNKPIESIFKENPTDYIQSQLINNKDSNNYIRHIGSQTIYREESTQTDPFSPVYTISGGEHPEVFALSDFTYGKGLPATSLEISFIERLRARREWEQDHTIDLTRTKIVIEREIREWQLREKEIKMLELARHQLFTNNLHNYIQADEAMTQSTIDLSIYRAEKQLAFQHQRLELKTARDIRRMKRIYRFREAQIDAVTSYQHLGVIGMVQKGNGCVTSLKPPWHTRPDDIITTFKNKISQMYTPCPSFDYLIDRRMNQSRINIFQLEQLIPKKALIAQIDGFDRLKSLQNNQNKKLTRRIRDLEKASQLIQEEKTKHLSTIEKKPLRFVEKIETINHVQQLQTTSKQTEAHNQRRIAIIKLQNYLRSIIVQSRIANVYQIRQDLLNELRRGLTTDQLSSFHHADENGINQFGSPRTQICDYLADETIADMLDFLSKELLRLQCEQTIHLFILLADRHRYQREAAETGARTRSMEQQKLEDRAIQEMFSLDSNCDIETYLLDLILHSISTTADDQARLEITQITETLISSSTDLFTSCNQSDIADLVHNFLFPIVQKLLTRHKDKCLPNMQ